MIVSFGRSCPHGSLPVFSVADEKEAQDLIVLACPTNAAGQYVAEELAQEQTLENLAAFGERLEKLHDEVLVPHGLCRCRPEGCAA